MLSSVIVTSPMKSGVPIQCVRKACHYRMRQLTLSCHAQCEDKGREPFSHRMASRITAGILGMSLALGSSAGIAEAIPVHSFEIVPQTDMRGISKITITVEADDSIVASGGDEMEVEVEVAEEGEDVALDESVDEAVVAMDFELQNKSSNEQESAETLIAEEEPEAIIAVEEVVVVDENDSAAAVIAEAKISPEAEIIMTNAEVAVTESEPVPDAEVIVADADSTIEVGTADAVVDQDEQGVMEPTAVQIAATPIAEDEVAEIASSDNAEDLDDLASGDTDAAEIIGVE